MANELKELEQALAAIEAVPERKIAALGVDDICSTYCQIRPYVLTVVKWLKVILPKVAAVIERLVALLDRFCNCKA